MTYTNIGSVPVGTVFRYMSDAHDYLGPRVKVVVSICAARSSSGRRIGVRSPKSFSRRPV